MPCGIPARPALGSASSGSDAAIWLIFGGGLRKELLDAVGIGPLKHAFFRNDRGDVLRIGDIEGGIVDGDALRRGLDVAEPGDLLRLPLLDRDLGPAGDAQVECAGGGGDVEGYAVVSRQDAHAVSAGL